MEDKAHNLALAMFLVFIGILIYIIVRMSINLMKDRDVLDGLFRWKKKDE